MIAWLQQHRFTIKGNYTKRNKIAAFPKPWVSKLFMAKGHTGYCGLVRDPHVQK